MNANKPKEKSGKITTKYFVEIDAGGHITRRREWCQVNTKKAVHDYIKFCFEDPKFGEVNDIIVYKCNKNSTYDYGHAYVGTDFRVMNYEQRVQVNQNIRPLSGGFGVIITFPTWEEDLKSLR